MDTTPDSGTSYDHIVSAQPGFIPQAFGRLTNARFWGSVLYADHYLDFSYNHLISGTSSLETLRSKHAYERAVKSNGVNVYSYREDKLRLNDTRFIGDCLRTGQNMPYCGVETHHQNAVADSKIKEVCYAARTVAIYNNLNLMALCYTSHRRMTQ